MNQIPFLDLSCQNGPLAEELKAAVSRVIDSGQFILGPEVEAFEEAWADYCGVQYSVALNSGTSALHLGLLALGVEPGDEVITVAHSFIATVEAILYCGATPVFVDIDPDTLVMDVNKVEAAITDRTRAVLPVHLYGNPVAMESLAGVAERHDLPILEDACQAHSAEYAGKRVGGWGAAGTFSFYPTKNLGGLGEGGTLTTNDEGVADRVRSYRNHGQSGIYQHTLVGYNYRMSGFQGAVLGAKLSHLDGWNEERRQIAGRYREAFEGTAARMMVETPGSTCTYHLAVVRVSDRDRVRSELSAAGIGTNIHYPTPIHRQPALAAGNGASFPELPETERAATEVLSLPLFPGLCESDQDRVIDTLLRAVGI
ncbi:DegT/DnrJ/EryC1/StrS family aminotransferase [Gemmatimonadota bacterium]